MGQGGARGRGSEQGRVGQGRWVGMVGRGVGWDRAEWGGARQHVTPGVNQPMTQLDVYKDATCHPPGSRRAKTRDARSVKHRGREGGREGGREVPREAGRQGGREAGREGGREGRRDRWTDRRTDGWMDGRMDGGSYGGTEGRRRTRLASDESRPSGAPRGFRAASTSC